MINIRGSVDRIEENIAIIIFDNGDIQNFDNTIELKEGDRIKKIRGIIKKIDNSKEKEEISELQKRIFRKGEEN